MKLFLLILAFFFHFSQSLASSDFSCNKFLGDSLPSLDDLKKMNHTVNFAGETLRITGSKVKIETEDTGRSIVRSLVFSDVKVYVSGVFNLLGMQSAHRLRGNSSALSALCSELTQGRLPYFISDYNNTSTGVFLPTRLVDVFTTDYGHVVQVSNERTFTNVFSDFICSDQGSTY